jgi:RimJ/RimL family protein N-acetyltransferase
MEFHGERVILRPITMDDFEDCCRWAGDAEVMRHVIQETKTPEEERTWLEKILTSEDEKVFVILNEHGKPIGTCGIHFSSTNPDLRNEEGYSLGLMIGEKSEWGKGYGPDALRTLADFTNRNYKTKRIWLTVDAVHTRAIRAYEKAGFSSVREIMDPSRINSGGRQILMELRY